MKRMTGRMLPIALILGLAVFVGRTTAMAGPSQVILIGEAAKGEDGMQKEESTSFGGQTKETVSAEGGNSLGLDIAAIVPDAETRQLVAVAGCGMDSSDVKVAYFKRAQDGVWTEEFCVSGFCGYHGMAVDKKEGDRRTPVGNYGFVTAFGILPDPGSRMPYKQLDDGDFWVDDSSSPYYNQMVNTKEVAWNWNSAEELMRIAPAYHYVLALDYNTAERIPGKGSAIFLHGIDPKKTWTEGCIAIPQERVKQLIQELDSTARIVIMPDNSGNFGTPDL